MSDDYTSANDFMNSATVQKLLHDYAVLVIQRRILIAGILITGLANILFLIKGCG